jgi:hypothetical protein
MPQPHLGIERALESKGKSFAIKYELMKERLLNTEYEHWAAGFPQGNNHCTGTNRQAMHPVTGQFLGPNSSLAIGTLVPNTGNPTNGLIRQGQGIADTNFVWPMLVLAPRFGAAYDVSGTQRVVLRGGTGLFYDRPNASTTTPAAGNPPTARNITVRYGQLQSLGRGGLTTEGPPALAVSGCTTRAACRPPCSGTAASRCCSRGRSPWMRPTSGSTASTRFRR